MNILLYHTDVRTTLTMDDDVEILLEQESRRSGASFQAVVNKFLGLVLAARKGPFPVCAGKIPGAMSSPRVE